MGYVLRLRIASFLTGAAVASVMAIYALHKDYKRAHQIPIQQADGLYQSLDARIAALEELQEVEATRPVEAAP